MWQAEQGVVIGAIRHNDKTNIVRIFTASHGMISFIWYLSKSGKNGARNTLLQPLTFLDFQTEYIPNKTLLNIKDAKNLSPHRDIPFNSGKSAIALFLSEFLTHALNGEECNLRLYTFLTSSIKWLDSATNNSYANFHISFMLGTAAHLGICPNNDSYTPGDVLDMRDGKFDTANPPHNDYIPAELSYKLHALMTYDYDKIKDAPLTRVERVRLLNSLNSYFRLHIPSFPVLKSIEIMETIFS